MSGDLRVLDDDDLPALQELLRRDLVANLFVASRVATFGLSRQRLGCAIYGYIRDGRLAAACHVGANIVPVAADDQALAGFVELIGHRHTAASIMGPADHVLMLYRGLSQRWRGWSQPREIRAHQPLMTIDHPATVPGDPRIKVMDPRYLEPYLSAAVAMYTEEVGVSPLDSSDSYRRYIRYLMQMGRAMGGVHNNRVWFKSDIGSVWEGACQVQGVWLDPALRGRGLSEPAMARVVELCRVRYPLVSLYVNDFNVRARRMYERIGFTTVGELATVLY